MQLDKHCSGECRFEWCESHLHAQVAQLVRCGVLPTDQSGQGASWDGPLTSPTKVQVSVPAGWKASG
jgi:hypothetical protein